MIPALLSFPEEAGQVTDNGHIPERGGSTESLTAVLGFVLGCAQNSAAVSMGRD